MPTLPAGSRSCAARNRRCGDRKRSAAWSRSTAPRRAAAARQRSVEAGSFDTLARRGADQHWRRRARRVARHRGPAQRRHRQLRRRRRARRLSQPRRARFAAVTGLTPALCLSARRASRCAGRASSTASIPSPSCAPTRSTTPATGSAPGGCSRDAWRPRDAAMPALRPACSARRNRNFSTTIRSTAPAPAAGPSALEAGHGIGAPSA